MKKEVVLKKLARIHFSYQLTAMISFAHHIGDKANFETLLDALYKIHGSAHFKECLQAMGCDGSIDKFETLVQNEIMQLFDEFAVLCDEIKAKDFRIYILMFFSIMFNVVVLDGEKQRKVIKKAARVLYEAKDFYDEKNLENLMNLMDEEMQDFLLCEMEKVSPLEKKVYFMQISQRGEA